ncbi:aldose epimerase [Lactobacillus sp. ESL0681]|uniref:aldose epimerase family protein n=1 Tax=Lactobacillus sp. ESL0681 TaxID=2983211 RepID=UPI0023F9ACCF|nr:aldose epimerase [Lactobacillus sp. ESL0681]WEV41174.1 aldose epimerase [Lactobacillus sp. ESL0681]
MQTIENSLLRLSIDEQGAELVSVISPNNQRDYFKNGINQSKLAIFFAENEQKDNLASSLPWTIIDKGDTQVSFALIDDTASYKQFPYHFEVILTYQLEGNRIAVKCYVQNNSHKQMPFSLKLVLDQLVDWQIEPIMENVELTQDELKLELSSPQLNLQVGDGRVCAVQDDKLLAGDSNTEYHLSLTLN